jgi:hypothetical protein
VELDVDRGIGLSRKEFGGSKDVGEVGVEDVVRLFEAVECT